MLNPKPAFVVLSSVLMLAACDRGSHAPATPTVIAPTPTPQPPPSSIANWSGDATVVAVTYGRMIPCGWGTSMGDARTGVGWRVTVDGDSILLDEDMANWPMDDVPFRGHLTGTEFTASYDVGPNYLSYVCEFKGGTLSGRFNPQFSSFEALETLVWGPPGGETTVQRRWVASRY